MGDEIDFDDLLAEAEQEGDMYDEYMDDIEAEMAMEAEVMRWCFLLLLLWGARLPPLTGTHVKSQPPDRKRAF